MFQNGSAMEERTFCIGTMVRVPDKHLDNHYHLVSTLIVQKER